jgi:hypothetical protein
MTCAELLALAERVEKAQGADEKALFALGAEVLVACGRDIPALNPCFSLDAAASLVPEGWSFEIRSTSAGRAWACAFTPGHFAGQCQGNTSALALTAAALRARAEEAVE